MADPQPPPPTGTLPPAAGTSGVTASAPSTAAPRRPVTDNPALRMMGLPRLRLPSRNWSIFLALTGSFASAVFYDKWQTRRTKQKWADLVSHIAAEPLSTKQMPRRLTIYLAAPPGDGLRSAREHFHEYIKPVLVAGGVDWDVVEGRKEGDVRHKTAERIRRKRKRAGEGGVVEQEELEKLFAVELMRERNGSGEFEGVAGDLVVGRNTWKEYVRGLHEGWLGPVDAPVVVEAEGSTALEPATHTSGNPSLGDAAVSAAAKAVQGSTPDSPAPSDSPLTTIDEIQSPQADPAVTPEEPLPEEKPKPRNPPAYITPSEYATATLSSSVPEIIGPSTAISFPHILGFRNTPIRMYRFLTRRRQADDIGRQVAAAVLASSYRSFDTTVAATAAGEESAASTNAGAEGRSVPEQTQTLIGEERNWWKTVHQPRKEGEESVWIEGMVVDERLASRMKMFELTSEDEGRAQRIAAGVEKVGKVMEAEVEG
ncbi:hypothetical protein LTR08_008973 [Meristemomyces frigidus]|nr:hypothetical protein LTR08_008973 [Meristemomyces frigidus]